MWGPHYARSGNLLSQKIIEYSNEETNMWREISAHVARNVSVAQSDTELHLLAIQSMLHYAVRTRGDEEWWISSQVAGQCHIYQL
jgi:hypothetical protein